MKGYPFGLPVTSSVYILYTEHIVLYSSSTDLPLPSFQPGIFAFASLSKYNKNLNVFLKCSLFLHSKLNTVMCFGIELTLWFSSNFR